MLKKIFGALLMMTLLVLPQNVFAAREEWVADGYNFHQIKNVIVLDVTVDSGLNYDSMVGLRGLQNKFLESCSNQLSPICKVYSESEAADIIGAQIGVNLEKLSLEDSMAARKLLIENAWRVADAYVMGVVDTWGGSKYVAPTDVEYNQVIVHRLYFDEEGRPHPDNPQIPVERRYRVQDTDVAAIGMMLRVCSAKNNSVIFERHELRYRKADESQIDLFSEISGSFAADVAEKIR